MVTLEHIRSFVEDGLWTLRQPITEHTALAHDFGVAGHDGKEFMEAYAARFGVDLGAFDWVEYFGPEGVNPLGLVAYLYRRLVRRIPARDLVDLPEITLGHLVVCANRGRWESPT